MNYREPPHMPVGTRRVLHCLSFLLLPALAPTAALSLPRSRPPADPAVDQTAPESLPYLTVNGVLPLRFQSPTPPPDLVTRPVAAAPPIPKLTPTEVAVAQNNAEAAQSAIDAPPAPPPPADSKPTEPAAAPKRATPAILPDNYRPAIRPEDFLPYFQLPGAGRSPADVNVIVPGIPSTTSNAPLPPSSATYTQTPR